MIENEDQNQTTQPTTTHQEQTKTMQTIDTETVKDLDTTIANLHIVREQAKELADHVEELEKRLSLARGTGDVTERARIAAEMDVAAPVAMPRTKTAPLPAAPKKPATTKERVEGALRGHSMNTAQISKATGLSIGKVSEALRQLRVDRRVTNVGSEDFPKWTRRIGNDTPTSELNAEVRRLISDAPMTMQELVEATGALTSRVSGCIVDIQRRNPDRILNLGNPRRARWLLLGPGAKVAGLSRKGEDNV